MTPSNLVPSKFQVLQDGDKIAPGDEYYNPVSDEWLPVSKESIGDRWDSDHYKPMRRQADVVHLLMPRGEIACGDGPGMLEPQADIDRVTCPECIEYHESREEDEEATP